MNKNLNVFSFITLALLASVLSQKALAISQPDWNKTPGFLCSEQDPNFAKFDYPEHIARCTRNVDTQEKLQIAQEYGNIPQAEWKNYEFDHLIPLCAGGSDDIRNLWPQPIDEAHLKDKLEDTICGGLRAGTMTQAEAVQKVHDWFNEQAQTKAIKPQNSEDGSIDD